MSNTEKVGAFLFTVPVFLNFPNVVKPRSYKGKGDDAKYDANLELPGDSPDIAGMKLVAAEVAKAKWPSLTLGDAVKSGELVVPWKSGDTLADKAKAAGKEREYSRGRIVLIARSNTDYPPKLSALAQNSFMEFEGERRPLATDYFYPGVEVLAEVWFRADEAQGQRFVSAKLQRLHSLNRGDRIAGQARSNSEVFRAYAGQVTSEDVGNVADEW